MRTALFWEHEPRNALLATVVLRLFLYVHLSGGCSTAITVVLVVFGLPDPVVSSPGNQQSPAHSPFLQAYPLLFCFVLGEILSPLDSGAPP